VSSPASLAELRRLLLTGRRIFVSYHHGGDREYYEAFSRLAADAYDAVEDNSVERLIDSDDAEYVLRTIRENYITGTSCTVVLCGAQTPWRKFVDWEIKATLDRQHGVIGANLPTNPPDANGRFTVPGRLYDNIESGYAVWTTWADLVSSAVRLRAFVEDANQRNRMLIRNGRAMRTRNG
jgi:hypothetical protein